MNKLEQTLADIAKLLADSAQQHGPAIGNVLLEAARVQCIQNIVFGSVCLLITVICIVAMKKIYAASHIPYENGAERDQDPYIMGGLAVGAVGLLSTILTLVFLLHVASWIGLGRPEVYIAHKILSKFVSN